MESNIFVISVNIKLLHKETYTKIFSLFIMESNIVMSSVNVKEVQKVAFTNMSSLFLES